MSPELSAKGSTPCGTFQANGSQQTIAAEHDNSSVKEMQLIVRKYVDVFCKTLAHSFCTLIQQRSTPRVDWTFSARRQGSGTVGYMSLRLQRQSHVFGTISVLNDN